jgi:hypothetical protein
MISYGVRLCRYETTQNNKKQSREELKFRVLKSGNTFTKHPFTGVNTKYRKVILYIYIYC